MSNGYTRIPVELRRMEMYGTWLLVAEDLAEQVSASGLVVNVGKKATTVGRVLKVGSGVEEDVREGDDIIYEEWQGGRWNIEDVDCLIMDIANVLAVVERED
jgi:co-chaperonin GroES (HSP10)